METSKIWVVLTSEEWKLIVFLADRGLAGEMRSFTNRGQHNKECLIGFMESVKALVSQLPESIADTADTAQDINILRIIDFADAVAKLVTALPGARSQTSPSEESSPEA